jgi:hypothetical protein
VLVGTGCRLTSNNVGGSSDAVVAINSPTIGSSGAVPDVDDDVLVGAELLDAPPPPLPEAAFTAAVPPHAATRRREEAIVARMRT